MTRFAGSWLDRREPADAAARHGGLSRRLARYLRDDAPARLLDLGCGTGANLRGLSSHLECPQRWTLLDNDPALLGGIGPRLSDWAQARNVPVTAGDDALDFGPHLQVDWREHDLARQPLMLDGVRAVTGSALIDLVSRDWLTRLARACSEARCAALLSLCYDGRVSISPRHDFDPAVRDAVNHHQRGDKGFGPALGPAAPAAASALFLGRGYRVRQARSDWRLGADEFALQLELLDGWAKAAAEILPRSAHGRLQRWQEWRLQCVDRGESVTRVGHVDLLALPPP